MGTAFVLSCIAVALDPLFLYVPIVDETNKCLTMDKKLRTTALVLRTLTDFLLLTHIIAEICQRIYEQTDDYLSADDYMSTDKYYLSTGLPKYLSEDSNHQSDKEFDPDPESLRLYPIKSFHKRKLPWLTFSLVIKLLAIIPVPQLAILVGFFRMTGSDFYVIRKFVNVALVLQYLPRIWQIYLTKNQFRMGGKWPQPLFNLYLYILAGHVLGSLWYFVAIERETSCWHKACKKIPGCLASSSYKCRAGDSTTKNIPFLNQLCPINSPNSTLFDFGIFVDMLKSGNTQSDKFATKLFYSLWWGLKNLSNFGTNLQTSNYLWENCFAILICVIGLLLFLYLIGNVQLYIQSATEISLEKEKSRTDKINKTYKDITQWMDPRFQDTTRKRIKQTIKEDKVVEKNLSHDVDVKYFLKHSHIRMSVMEHLGVNAMKKVPMLKYLDDTTLKALSQKLKPVILELNGLPITKQKEPLSQMLFILKGTIKVHSKGDVLLKTTYYGREILEWVSFNRTSRSYCDSLPLSTELAEPYRGNVEALALDTWELFRFLDKHLNIIDPDAKQELNDFADSYKKKLADADAQNGCKPDEDLNIQASADQWSPPETGSVKLNCTYDRDDNTNQAWYGCVLRNEKREFIAAEGNGTGQCIDSFEAGALSIQLCLSYSLKHVKTSSAIIVESDHKLLIKFLVDREAGRLPSSDDPRVRGILQPTLQKIADDIQKFTSYKFKYCNPQANAAALCVAKHARASGYKEWKGVADIPAELVDTLEKDSPRRTEKSSPSENPALAQEIKNSGASSCNAMQTNKVVKEAQAA